jgi:hypothetical protein
MRCRGDYLLEYMPGEGKSFHGEKVQVLGIEKEDGSGRKWIVTVIGDKIPRVGVYWDEAVPCPFFHLGYAGTKADKS